MTDHQLFLFLVQLVAIVTLARVGGELALRLGIPEVVGELVFGIALGPSLFGLIWPAGFEALFPADPVGRNLLEIVAWLGVIFLALISGSEIRLRLLRSAGRVVVLAWVGGFGLPFGLGFLFGWFTQPELIGPGISRTVFALFIATAMSISAIPVIARILPRPQPGQDPGRHGHPVDRRGRRHHRVDSPGGYHESGGRAARGRRGGGHGAGGNRPLPGPGGHCRPVAGSQAAGRRRPPASSARPDQRDARHRPGLRRHHPGHPRASGPGVSGGWSPHLPEPSPRPPGGGCDPPGGAGALRALLLRLHGVEGGLHQPDGGSPSSRGGRHRSGLPGQAGWGRDRRPAGGSPGVGGRRGGGRAERPRGDGAGHRRHRSFHRGPDPAHVLDPRPYRRGDDPHGCSPAPRVRPPRSSAGSGGGADGPSEGGAGREGWARGAADEARIRSWADLEASDPGGD